MKELLIEGLAEWDRRPLFEASGERRLVFGMAQDAADLYDCPHLANRDFFLEVEHPVAGAAQYAGFGPLLQGDSYQVLRPAPLLGEHNHAVYCRRLGLSDDEMVCLRAGGVI